jgi:glycosyltransferase involved in cell wall biosynthesis
MPIHNEESHVLRAIARVPEFADLVIAVDDGSDDGTWSLLSRIESRRLVRLRHSRNLGVGAATKTGYRYARDAGMDLIAVMDGDGQMAGADLSRLLDPAIEGADYVKGNRFLHHTLAVMPLSRYAGNVLFSWLTRHACGLGGCVDAQCGYAVIRSGALSRVDLDALYDRYGFLNDMLFAMTRASLTVESVPVHCVYGQETSGINPAKVVPAILYLICRRYLRRKVESLFGLSTPPLASPLSVGSSETTPE